MEINIPEEAGYLAAKIERMEGLLVKALHNLDADNPLIDKIIAEIKEDGKS